MSFSEVKKAIEEWSPDDQDRLAAFLTALRLRREPAYMEELDRRIRDTDSSNWMSLNDLKRRLKEG